MIGEYIIIIKAMCYL